MFETPIHVIDFEGSRQSGVVEYGFVTLQHGEIVGSQTRICAPNGTISDMDRVQHGISEEIAADYTEFNKEWMLFADLRESGPFCAHNAAVEEDFLRAVWPSPRVSPDFSKPECPAATWGPWLDTLHIYRRLYPQLANHKLQSLMEAFEMQGLLDEQASMICPSDRSRYHCALYDALASAMLLQRLGEDPKLKDASLHWLLLQSASSGAARKHMVQQDLL